MSIFLAMLRKDLRVLLKQRQIIITMSVLPLMMSVFLPLMFIFMLFRGSADFEAAGGEVLFANVPEELLHLPGELQQLMMLLNNLLPGYFLMIPIMCGSVLAAGSFVTEREHKTMEALLYSPLSLRQLLLAKLSAALVPALAVSWGSALLTALAINIPCYLLRGITPFPTPIWWVILLWLLPIFAGIGLSFSVLISASAQTYQEAQQKSALIVMPLLLLILGPLLGFFTFNAANFIMLGAILLLILGVLLALVVRGFKVEKLI